MSYEEKEIYEFGGFRLDVAEHTLTNANGGGNGALPEKAFRTLCVLVRNHGHLVTKDELLERVWPGTVVEENNLDKAIHAIRHALGENSGEQKYIETVRKHGYRFVGEVRKADSEPGADGRQAGTQVSRPRRWLRLIAATGFVAVAVGLLFFLFSWNRPVSSTRSLFVLPVQPIGAANQRDDLLELGIADAVINRLASSNLLVRPLSATREHVGASMDPVEAGKRQNVNYVLASNYQIADGKIRVTSQLVDVADGKVVDTFKNEFEFRSLFGVQDTVAAELGSRILRALNAGDISPVAGRGTSNEQAYRAYLEGMHHYDLRSREGAEKAAAALTHAVEIDPSYARAWAGKAHAHLSAAGFGRDSDIHGQNAMAKDAIDRALSIDDNLTEAYSALCIRTLTYDYDLRAAEQHCKKAIELDQNSGIAHQNYSRLLNAAGRHDEAIAEIKTAIDLDPASIFNHRLLGYAYHYARRHDEAAEQLTRVMNMDPRGPTVEWLSLTLSLGGRESDAYEWWKKRLEQRSEAERGEWDNAFAQEGWKGIMRLRARNFEKENLIFSHGAGFHAYIGEADKAVELLEKALERREAYLPHVRVDPRFDPIRKDPRFEAFLTKTGFSR